MSAGDETVLGRWSRLKEAARRREKAGEAAAAPDVGGPGASPPPAPAQEEAPAPEPAAAADEPLPSLDDLSADSDLSRFLRKEVPETLRRAAFRKMWSLDPRIRDHAGPAECDWNFNDPDSIPGFGRLGARRPTAAEFLSRPGESKPPADPPVSSVRKPDHRPLPESVPSREVPPESAPADAVGYPAGSRGAGEATARESTTKDDPETARHARRHGGALPRAEEQQGAPES